MAVAQTPPTGSRQFAPGALQRISDLPAGRFRAQVDQLKPAVQQKTLEWLRRFHLPESDTRFLHVDKEGGVFYSDEFDLPPAAVSGAETEPGLYEVDGVVEAAAPGLRLHGVQFTPLAPGA